MTASVVQIGAAVVSLLAAPPLELVASFAFAPETALLNSPASLQVIVSPAAVELTPADRSTTFRDHRLWILVRKKLGTETSPPAMEGYEVQVGELVELVEQITNALHRSVAAGAFATSVSVDPLLDRAHLREQNQFVSIITVTYRQRS